MATKPGVLTDWPWKALGNFKYMILAPWAIHATYLFATKGVEERDLGYVLVLPIMLMRMLHHQIWTSLSRYKTAKGSNMIVDKGIDFDQVDRERTWDDQIILIGIFLYVLIGGTKHLAGLPFWRTDGVVLTALFHMGLVEWLYYWFHRALHHHFLYSRYHSHHHSSIVTEPISGLVHPFWENIVYSALFFIPILTTILTRTPSIISVAGYITYVDFMNNMGHCNFEFVPKWLFSVFPPLKFLMYTPSFHSLHHSQFRTNYSLFMPIYDYIYGTKDKSTDALYDTSLKREGESPDVVHMTHLTTWESIYHLRVGFSSLASKPYASKWYLMLMWHVTLLSVFLTWIYGHAFISESNIFDNLKLQSWVIPRYSVQYLMESRRETINGLIEEAILEAEKMGVKVLSLGLLNQIWVVGDGLSEEEQSKAPRGTLFIPFSQFPPKKMRKDCIYHTTPALMVPTSFQNLHSCENWLPRMVMRACRVAGIIHALEGWEENECGLNMLDVDKVWRATLQHGFCPFKISI